jgi:hypothetical protein
MLDEILGMAFAPARNEGEAYLVASAGFAGKSMVTLLCVRGLVEGRGCKAVARNKDAPTRTSFV